MNEIKSLGLRMPAEWEPQSSVWFSWPHNTDTWPMDGKYQNMIKQYCFLIGTLAQYQLVNINVSDNELERIAKSQLLENGFVDYTNIRFHHHPTNDAWCRDHGPIFVKDKNNQKIILDWEYNAWGGKYPPFDDDNKIPKLIANKLNLPFLSPGIVLEGGSIEVNGKGTLLTTKSCLLNKNRNPLLSMEEIENYLKIYLGVTNILWLEDGVEGDDTDGHIDDLTRFVNPTTLVTVVERNEKDENYDILQNNLKQLKNFKDQDGNPFTIIELPMPLPLEVDGVRLPASYANFLITNKVVLVPTFNDPNDETALTILQNQFTDRKVIGVPSQHIVWGLGTIHCLSQQEPL
jgi:agmatine deiminase